MYLIVSEVENWVVPWVCSDLVVFIVVVGKTVDSFETNGFCFFRYKIFVENFIFKQSKFAKNDQFCILP